VTNYDLVDGCYSCEQQRTLNRPPREDVVSSAYWRAAHAFNSTLPGWLVIVPARHLLSFAELTKEEAAELGDLVRRLSVVLQEVTGCVKTYLMQFSEAEGFGHLHLHLVPRMADQPEHVRGPRIFAYLSEPESAWLSEARRDEVAIAIRERIQPPATPLDSSA
jgi:diadenosine tetraphosphate (Ap4A) HIT family hydrolase